MSVLLDGRAHAKTIGVTLRRTAAQMKKTYGVSPVLASVAVTDAASVQIYTQAQKRIAHDVGIEYRSHTLAQTIAEKELLAFIEGLNNDPSVNGILLQLPLPRHLDYTRIVSSIAVDKDVEGMHPENMGRLVLGQRGMIACTALAVMEMVALSGVDPRGKEAVVVGHSEIVGKPVALLLLERLATVSVCHIATSQAGKLEGYVKNADILVVAVGKPGLIKGEWIKPGALVIDVGINKSGEKTVGDVEFLEAQKRAAFITPVPGGVGPLTVMMLMKNVCAALALQRGGR